jgi:hypothetical protein
MLEKSMKLKKSNVAQNLLYKLDTMRRRHTQEQNAPSTASTKSQSEAAETPKKPEYT